METKIIINSVPASTRSDGWIPPGPAKVFFMNNIISGGCNDSICGSGIIGRLCEGQDFPMAQGHTGVHIANGNVRIEINGSCTISVNTNALPGAGYLNTIFCGGNGALTTASNG